MVFAVEHTNTSRNPAIDQRRVHLQSLIDRTPIVLVGMDEQRRRLYILCIFQRRMIPEFFVIGVEICLVLIADEIVTDVGNAVETQPVRNRSLRRTGTEQPMPAQTCIS